MRKARSCWSTRILTIHLPVSTASIASIRAAFIICIPCRGRSKAGREWGRHCGTVVLELEVGGSWLGECSCGKIFWRNELEFQLWHVQRRIALKPVVRGGDVHTSGLYWRTNSSLVVIEWLKVGCARRGNRDQSEKECAWRDQMYAPKARTRHTTLAILVSTSPGIRWRTCDSWTRTRRRLQYSWIAFKMPMDICMLWYLLGERMIILFACCTASSLQEGLAAGGLSFLNPAGK